MKKILSMALTLTLGISLSAVIVMTTSAGASAMSKTRLNTENSVITEQANKFAAATRDTLGSGTDVVTKAAIAESNSGEADLTGKSAGEIFKCINDLVKQGKTKISIKSDLPESDVWAQFDAIYNLTGGTILVFGSTGYSVNNDVYQVNYDDEGKYTDEQLQNMYKQLKTKTKQILDSIIKPGMTDYDKELAIHDYLIYHVKGYANSNKADYSDCTAYSALVKGTAESPAFSVTNEFLLYQLGIPCSTIRNSSDSWNIVTIDGKNYHENTYSDFEMVGQDFLPGQDPKLMQHMFFNRTDREMSQSFSWDKKIYTTNCYSKDAAYLPALYTYKDVIESIRGYVQNGASSFNLNIYNYNTKTYNMATIKKAVNTQLNWCSITKLSSSIGSRKGNIYNIKFKAAVKKE